MAAVKIRRWVGSKAFWEAAVLIVCWRTVSRRLKVADKLLEGKRGDPIRPKEQCTEPCNTPIWIMSEGIVVGTCIMFSNHGTSVVIRGRNKMVRTEKISEFSAF